MKINDEILSEMRVKPGDAADLNGRSMKHLVADWLSHPDKDGNKNKSKKVAKDDLE